MTKFVDSEQNIFLHKSGGKCSSEPHLRRCRWAWITYWGGRVLGQHGGLEGRQTVPRSEPKALGVALAAVVLSAQDDHVPTIVVFILTTIW